MSSKLKYFFIPYIALGLTLSVLFGVRYECIVTGDVLPTYYGNPFVFKLESLGSSLTYTVGIWSLLLNIIIHILVLIILRIGILKLIKKLKDGIVLKTFYGIGVGVLMGLSTLVIAAEYVMNSNTYVWNLEDIEAAANAYNSIYEADWFYNFKD
jgi:hypothetical protein